MEAMSDQEKIKAAADKHQEDLFSNWGDYPSCSISRTCNEDIIPSAFEAGVEWRDANPNPKRSVEVQIKPIINQLMDPLIEKFKIEKETVFNRTLEYLKRHREDHGFGHAYGNEMAMWLESKRAEILK